MELLLEHWSFFAALGLFYVFGGVIKRSFLSPERAKTSNVVRFVRRWLPLPLHPIAGGIALGFIPGMPLPTAVIAYPLGPSIYFMLAGIASIVWHDAYREWCKYRGAPTDMQSNGITLDDRDLDSLPPASGPG